MKALHNYLRKMAEALVCPDCNHEKEGADPRKTLTKCPKCGEFMYHIDPRKATDDEAPTKDMIDFYEKRTRKHIRLVNENIAEIVKVLPEYDLKYDHDASKFSPEEYIPYVWLTAWYRSGKKLKYPEGMQEKVDAAVKHHYEHNTHHEEHATPAGMSNKDLVEMISDWGAMAIEKGGTIKSWAVKHLGGFTPGQKEFIGQLINILEP